METTNGRLTTTKDIINEAKKFSTKLRRIEPAAKNIQDHILLNIKKTSVSTKELLSGEMTEFKLMKTIEISKDESAPGPDKLNWKLQKTFRKE